MGDSPPERVEELRKILVELGYNETLPDEAVPLVNHILLDFKYCTRPLQEDKHQSTQQLQSIAALEDLFDRDALDTLDTLDTSLLSLAEPMGDSMLLQTVELAHRKIESLRKEIIDSRVEKERVVLERDNAVKRANKSESEVNLLQDELKTLRQRLLSVESNDASRIRANAVLNNVMLELPERQRSIIVAKLSDCDGLEQILSLIMESLQFQSRELGDLKQKEQATQFLANSLSQQQRSLEETIQNLKSQNLRQLGQITELTSKLNQCDFELSLYTDIKSQLDSMQALSETVSRRIDELEKLKSKLHDQPTQTDYTAFDSIYATTTAELQREIHRTSRSSLATMQRLETRCLEQEREISHLNMQLTESQDRTARLEREKLKAARRQQEQFDALSAKEVDLEKANMTISSFQRAIQLQQAKLSERDSTRSSAGPSLLSHSVGCSKELLTALEQCRTSTDAMRRSEELTKKHVIIQDGEIQTFRAKFKQSMQEKSQLVQKTAGLESKLVSAETKVRMQLEEIEDLQDKVQSILISKQQALEDLRKAKEDIAKLEGAIALKERESHFKTTAFLKVMTEKGRLEAKLLCNNQRALVQTPGDVELQKKVHELEGQVNRLTNEANQLREQLALKEARFIRIGTKMEKYRARRDQLQEDLRQRDAQLALVRREYQCLWGRERFIMNELAAASKLLSASKGTP